MLVKKLLRGDAYASWFPGRVVITEGNSERVLYGAAMQTLTRHYKEKSILFRYYLSIGYYPHWRGEHGGCGNPNCRHTLEWCVYS